MKSLETVKKGPHRTSRNRLLKVKDALVRLKELQVIVIKKSNHAISYCMEFHFLKFLIGVIHHFENSTLNSIICKKDPVNHTKK